MSGAAIGEIEHALARETDLKSRAKLKIELAKLREEIEAQSASDLLKREAEAAAATTEREAELAAKTEQLRSLTADLNEATAMYLRAWREHVDAGRLIKARRDQRVQLLAEIRRLRGDTSGGSWTDSRPTEAELEGVKGAKPTIERAAYNVLGAGVAGYYGAPVVAVDADKRTLAACEREIANLKVGA